MCIGKQFRFSQFFFKMHLEIKICQIELVFDFWVIYAAAAPPVWRIYLFFGFLANKNLVLLFDFGVESFHVNFMIFLVSSTSVKNNQVILTIFRSFMYWKAISIFSIFLYICIWRTKFAKLNWFLIFELFLPLLLLLLCRNLFFLAFWLTKI